MFRVALFQFFKAVSDLNRLICSSISMWTTHCTFQRARFTYITSATSLWECLSVSPLAGLSFIWLVSLLTYLHATIGALLFQELSTYSKLHKWLTTHTREQIWVIPKIIFTLRVCFPSTFWEDIPSEYLAYFIGLIILDHDIHKHSISVLILIFLMD